MKTVMTAKIIFETPDYADLGEESSLEPFSLTEMRELINNADNDITVECVLDMWGSVTPMPVFIFRVEKKDINKLSTENGDNTKDEAI